jgi:glycosyltransferase involved in cell wall biosynthesis
VRPEDDVADNAQSFSQDEGGDGIAGARVIPISVVVPVKNEEKNLARCLEQLGRFAEVIVVDSMSVDATLEIVHRFGARVVQFQWDGRYPKKRNWLLINHPPAQPWVLFLDADEVVDERFCDAAAAAVMDARYNGYWLNYTNYFLERKLDHGVPQRKLALFRVGSGLYERIDEVGWSKLDMEIHEHPVIEGPVGEIEAKIEHHDFQGLSKFIDRHRNYAIWEARRYLLLERELRVQKGEKNRKLTSRQRFKYGNLERWWYPWVYFGYTYVMRRGFLDGAAGFYYACYKAWYFTTVRLLIHEMRGQVSNG